MSAERRSAWSTSTTVILSFLQAVVMTWAALSTDGPLMLTLWAFVGLYVIGLLFGVIALSLAAAER